MIPSTCEHTGSSKQIVQVQYHLFSMCCCSVNVNFSFSWNSFATQNSQQLLGPFWIPCSSYLEMMITMMTVMVLPLIVILVMSNSWSLFFVTLVLSSSSWSMHELYFYGAHDNAVVKTLHVFVATLWHVFVVGVDGRKSSASKQVNLLSCNLRFYCICYHWMEKKDI